MRRILFALLLVGCSKDDPAPPAPRPTEGGTLAIEGCGYSVTTQYGAEAPAPATGQVGADPTPRFLHLGIVGDPKTSIVAQWRTVDDDTHAGMIRYAKGADLAAEALTETAPGIEFGYDASPAHPRVHQAHLCGLEPGTAYSYQVGSGDHWSAIYTFRTAPDIVAHPDAEVVIASAGDSRNGYDIWSQLVDLLGARDPDLVLFSGDAVDFGVLQDEWDTFLERAEPLFARTPVVLANGNHEFNAVGFYSLFALPGDQENFSLDYGHAHIVVLNDTPVDPAAITAKSAAFLEADLTAHDSATWKLAMHHKAVFSAGNHGSTLELQQAWQPIYDAHHVDLVLNGHDHDFQISKPMLGANPQASVDDGTVYVVQGGAGADLYDHRAEAFITYAEKTYGASILHVRANQLTLEAFRADGSAIPAGFMKTK